MNHINAYEILVEIPEEKRQHGGLSCRWDDNIRMDLRKIEWEVVAGFVWPGIGTSDWLL
jgi:hypothetical protein